MYVVSKKLDKTDFENMEQLAKVVSKEARIITNKTIKFNANGGSGTMADIIGVYGEMKLPVNGFTAPKEKIFKGWSLTKDGKVLTSLFVEDDITLYAVWENAQANPKTGDKILTYVIVASSAVVLCIGAALYLKFSNKKK